MTNCKEKMVLAITALCFFFASCIQTEAPNAEADIVSCIVPEGILLGNPQIENNRITLRIDPAVDPDVVADLAIDFVLTEGATIDPPSGSVRDFTNPQTYKVTSQDKEWEKTYTVTCIIGGIGEPGEPGEEGSIVIPYNFENFRVHTAGTKKYYEFYEVNKDGSDQLVWASGNSGFSIVITGKDPDEYPTISVPEGKTGAGVKLETKSTGTLGNLMKMPLAAGNLFLGNFDLKQATKPLESTHFGEVFNLVPTGITGYYKYKAGEVYKDKTGTVIPDKKDSFDIYGIFFETDDEVEFLDGNNSLTSPNLISVARISTDSKLETDEWTHFYIPFEMLQGKEVDPLKLKNNKYKLSIVFSSSIDGAYFSGAVGSTLYIDQVQLIHLEKK